MFGEVPCANHGCQHGPMDVLQASRTFQSEHPNAKNIGLEWAREVWGMSGFGLNN
jgi:hypothetical protein